MKILIFDDNKRDREHLTNCLKTFFKNKDISYQITICQNKNELLNDIDSYDFLFLDIELGQENGIDLGLELQKIEHHCRIIITTNYSKYAIDGYKIHAERYFIKPINQQEFDLEMNGVIKNYIKDKNYFFDKKICDSKIYIKDILYIEFIDRKSIIHKLNGEIIMTNCTLKHWYDKLRDYHFAYPYKAFLVNLKYVNALYKKDIELTNGEMIPLSRHYKKEFKTKYIDLLQDTL